MTRRVVSTIVLWAVVAAVLWTFRTVGAVALVVLISIGTLRELYRLLAAAGMAPFSRLGMFFGALLTASPWVEARFGPPAHALLPLASVVFAIRVLGERETAQRLPALFSTLFGLVYVALMLQYFVRIATPLAGDSVGPGARILLCIWLVAAAKFCDTGALLAGLAFGRHLMAPNISPKKTWEGAAGGIAVSALVGALFAWAARSHLPPLFGPARAALLAVPVAMAAIVSDLLESIVKRQAECKDSGHAVPGIGGIFDVTDSLLLAAPVGYFLLRASSLIR